MFAERDFHRVLVSEVILVKPGVSKTFVIVDAAMNDLIRPTLYDAWHDILPVRRSRPDAAARHPSNKGQSPPITSGE